VDEATIGSMLDRRRAFVSLLLLIVVAPVTLAACRRHEWKGHMRLDGVYQATIEPASPVPHGPKAKHRFLRFLADGRVLTIYMSNDAEFAAKVLVPGYVDTSNRGQWSIAGDEIEITLNSDSVAGVSSRNAKGKITEQGADLSWGSGGSDKEHYDFIPVAVQGE
jgi:hypothetical protein